LKLRNKLMLVLTLVFKRNLQRIEVSCISIIWFSLACE